MLDYLLFVFHFFASSETDFYLNMFDIECKYCIFILICMLPIYMDIKYLYFSHSFEKKIFIYDINASVEQYIKGITQGSL